MLYLLCFTVRSQNVSCGKEQMGSKQSRVHCTSVGFSNSIIYTFLRHFTAERKYHVQEPASLAKVAYVEKSLVD